MGESPLDPLGGDYSAGQWQKTGAVGEGGPTHPDDTVRKALQPRWRTGSSRLLDYCDVEAGREEQSSPTFDLQRCVSSATFAPLHWSIQLKRQQVIFRAQVGMPYSSFMQKPNEKPLKHSICTTSKCKVICFTFKGTFPFGLLPFGPPWSRACSVNK